MAKYNYTAIDPTGAQKTGKIEADSEETAKNMLAAQGLMVTTIASAVSRSSATKIKSKQTFGLGKIIKTEDLAVFTRQLATLLEAGLPLLRGLEVMIRQERNKRFKQVLTGIAENVRSGNNMSDGLMQYPRVFDRLFVNMVKAGEAGGVLDVVLGRLAKFMEKSVKTAKKVKSAMVYPMVVVTVAVIIVAVLMVFVVPQFQKIFADMLGGAALPAVTQLVVNVSTFMQENILATIGIAIAVYFGFKMLMKTKVGRRAKDKMALSIPKIKDFNIKVNVSRFARTFGTLMSSGVPILEALTITRDTIPNSVVQDALTKVHDRVRDGESLATPLEQQKIFPNMVTSMIDVGEETGELSEMLNRIADNYDEDLDNAVAALTSIIEPVMIAGLAVIVGTIVIALFLPIIKIVQSIAS